MNKCIAIGHHDFEEIRTKNLYYVDKTDFIRRLDASNHKIYLFPRPRRFGKTLNMMLLRRYFEISETSKATLFDGLKIKEWEQFDYHLGRYPVIWLSFKDIKQQNWQDSYASILLLLQSEYGRHRYLETSTSLSENEKNYVKSILNREASVSDYQLSILKLCEFLYLHRIHPSNYNSKVPGKSSCNLLQG